MGGRREGRTSEEEVAKQRKGEGRLGERVEWSGAEGVEREDVVIIYSILFRILLCRSRPANVKERRSTFTL